MLLRTPRPWWQRVDHLVLSAKQHRAQPGTRRSAARRCVEILLFRLEVLPTIPSCCWKSHGIRHQSISALQLCICQHHGRLQTLTEVDSRWCPIAAETVPRFSVNSPVAAKGEASLGHATGGKPGRPGPRITVTPPDPQVFHTANFLPAVLWMFTHARHYEYCARRYGIHCRGSFIGMTRSISFVSCLYSAELQ